jgi:hypothetical protein
MFERKSKHVYYIQICFPENRVIYEVMLKNMVEPDRPQII